MKKLFFLSLIGCFFSLNLIAADFKDITNSHDNPLISRLKGSSLVYQKKVEWDTYILPVSKIIKVDGVNTWKKKLKIQGEVTRTQYITKKENNPSFVYANYINALKKAEWNILFSGDNDDALGNDSFEWQFTMFQEGLRLGEKFGSKYNMRGKKYAYIAAQFKDAKFTYYLSLYIVAKDDLTLINQDIIKEKNPDVGLVTAQDMKNKIDAKGHIALDGVYFTTGSATITPESKPALQNIAEYLNTHKDKKFFIVGHTDNIGDFNANMKLSNKRAHAVISALVKSYGVNYKQLKAYGMANLSPVMTNTTEVGRSTNRRVEIVEQ